MEFTPDVKGNKRMLSHMNEQDPNWTKTKKISYAHECISEDFQKTQYEKTWFERINSISGSGLVCMEMNDDYFLLGSKDSYYKNKTYAYI